MHNVQKVRALLTELASFFDPANTLNPLRCEMQWSSVRLNLAGVEPLLYERQAFNIITQARELGFEVYMIINGSRLSQRPLDELAGSRIYADTLHGPLRTGTKGCSLKRAVFQQHTPIFEPKTAGENLRVCVFPGHMGGLASACAPGPFLGFFLQFLL